MVVASVAIRCGIATVCEYRNGNYIQAVVSRIDFEQFGQIYTQLIRKMYIDHDQVGSVFPAIFMIWLDQQILALGRQLRRAYVLSPYL